MFFSSDEKVAGKSAWAGVQVLVRCSQAGEAVVQLTARSMEMNWEDLGALSMGDVDPPRMYHFVRVRAAAGAEVEIIGGCWAVVREVPKVRRRIRE